MILHFKRLLTLLSKKVVSAVDFGMVIATPVVDTAAGPSDAMEVTEPSVSASASGAEQGLGGAQQQTQPAAPVVRPDVPTSVAIQPSSDAMTIAGVEVKRTSSIAVLKAACQFLEVSQSGSKAKLWNRILAAVDRGNCS